MLQRQNQKKKSTDPQLENRHLYIGHLALTNRPVRPRGIEPIRTWRLCLFRYHDYMFCENENKTGAPRIMAPAERSFVTMVASSGTIDPSKV